MLTREDSLIWRYGNTAGGADPGTWCRYVAADRRDAERMYEAQCVRSVWSELGSELGRYPTPKELVYSVWRSVGYRE